MLFSVNASMANFFLLGPDEETAEEDVWSEVSLLYDFFGSDF